MYYELIKYEIVKYVKRNWETEKQLIEHLYKIKDKNKYSNYMSTSINNNNVKHETVYAALIFLNVYKKSIKILHKHNKYEIYETLIVINATKTKNNKEIIYFLLNSRNIYDITGHYNLLLFKDKSTNQLLNTQLPTQIIYKKTYYKNNNDNNIITTIELIPKKTNQIYNNQLPNSQINYNNIENIPITNKKKKKKHLFIPKRK